MRVYGILENNYIQFSNMEITLCQYLFMLAVPLSLNVILTILESVIRPTSDIVMVPNMQLFSEIFSSDVKPVFVFVALTVFLSIQGKKNHNLSESLHQIHICVDGSALLCDQHLLWHSNGPFCWRTYWAE